MSWYKWRVILTETQSEEFVLRLEDNGPPVFGPNGEEIDTSKSRIVEEKDENEVSIREMETKTGTHYRYSQIKLSCPPKQTVQHVQEYGADVNIVSASCQSLSNMAGDRVSWFIDPYTTAGVLTKELDIGDSVLSVSPTVIANADQLYHVRLASLSSASTIYEDLGEILEIDRDNSTITVSGKATNTWAASSYIQLTLVFVDDVEFSGLEWVMDIGRDRIGTFYLKKGRKLVCEYTNNSDDETHNLYYQIAYMYGEA